MKIRIKDCPMGEPIGYAGLRDVPRPIDVEARYVITNGWERVAYVSYDNMRKLPGFRWVPGDTEKEGDDYKFDRTNCSWWPLRSIAELVGEEAAQEMMLERDMKRYLNILMDEYTDAVGEWWKAYSAGDIPGMESSYEKQERIRDKIMSRL